MSRFFTAVALAAGMLCLPPAGLAQSKPADIPVESFFKRPDVSAMSLSPDGKTLAALKSHRGRNNIIVVNLENRKPQVITSFEQFDVFDFHWVNNKRIFFRVADIRDTLGRARFIGTYAIDTDGENLRNLTDGGRPVQPGQRQIKDIVPLARTNDGTDDLIVEVNERFEAVDVIRIDTKTGRTQAKLTSDAPANTSGFLLDWNRVPRVAWSRDPRKGNSTVWYRESATSPWTELYSEELGLGRETMNPVAFNADNKTLFVASNIGRDKAALYTYDPSTKKLGDLILEHPLIDIWGGLEFDEKTHKLIGVQFDAESPTTIWIDPDLRKLQAQVDATLKGKVNEISWGALDPSRVLVYSWADNDPGQTYLLTRSPLRIEPLLPSRPDMKPELLAKRQYITYKARDGMEIPAWVTFPKEGGGKNLPLIVNIHGGPWARVYGGNNWNFRPEAQFFASRGYVVLEPEPRGSVNFGRKHLTSAFKKWGQSMQDDITDGALHLVNLGIADRKRICLYGGSYGGYATLQGLVREPDLFKCGAPFVAVTDLVEFLTSNESDTNMQKMDISPIMYAGVGDPSKDRAMLEANSPARNAKRIKVPVLLAMGQIDVRVPLQHGRLMRSAMEDAGVKHEYLTYPGEGHGWNKDEHVFDWYKRVEKFFADNLK